jgi:hypothetical protein
MAGLRNAASIRAQHRAGGRVLFRLMLLRGPRQYRLIWANDGLSIHRRSARDRKVIVIP